MRENFKIIATELLENTDSDYFDSALAIEIMKIERLSRIVEELGSLNRNLSSIDDNMESLDKNLDSCISRIRNGGFLCVTGNINSY